MKILKSLTGIGALPVDFRGTINGRPFVVKVQHKIDGTVSAQIWSEKNIVSEVTATNKVSAGESFALWAYDGKIDLKRPASAYQKRDQAQIKKAATNFVNQLSSEVKDYNTKKDQRIKKPVAQKDLTPKTVKPRAKTTSKAVLAHNKKVEAKRKPVKQSGGSNLEMDKRLKAKPPGKRKSASGATYYEYRRNRSDKPGSNI